MPTLDLDIEKQVDLDHEVKASGFLKEELGKDLANIDKVFDDIASKYLDNAPANDEEEEESGEEENNEEEKKEDDK